MSFDIDRAANALTIEDDGAVVEILDENGEPATDDDGTPVTITVAGVNSKLYRKAEFWQRQQFQNLRGRKQTAEESVKMQAEFIARCTMAWKGFSRGGVPVPFSVEQATQTYLALPFVQRQVEQAMGDRSRFFQKPSAS